MREKSITGFMAEMPEGLSVKAQMAWVYFFENGWVCIATEDGGFIVMDEELELGRAQLFPDEDALEAWLESITDDMMSDREGAIHLLDVAMGKVAPGLRSIILQNPGIVFPLICAIGAEGKGSKDDGKEEDNAER